VDEILNEEKKTRKERREMMACINLSTFTNKQHSKSL
jgi:hypothetical protein